MTETGVAFPKSTGLTWNPNTSRLGGEGSYAIAPCLVGVSGHASAGVDLAPETGNAYAETSDPNALAAKFEPIFPPIQGYRSFASRASGTVDAEPFGPHSDDGMEGEGVETPVD